MDDGIGHAAQQASSALHSNVSDHDQRRFNLTCHLQNHVFGLAFVDNTGGFDAAAHAQPSSRPLGKLCRLTRFTEDERVATDPDDAHPGVAVCAHDDEASVEELCQIGGPIDGQGSGLCISSTDDDHFGAGSSTIWRVTHAVIVAGTR